MMPSLATALFLPLLPLALAQSIPSPYFWNVTGWEAGCYRAGCSYNFNVSGAAVHTDSISIPAFKAYCSGDESYVYDGAVYKPFKDCEMLESGAEGTGVAADLLEGKLGNQDARIRVSLRFAGSEEGSYFNYTGNATSIYNAFVAPNQNFTITPTEAFGVA